MNGLGRGWPETAISGSNLNKLPEASKSKSAVFPNKANHYEAAL